MNKKEKYFLLYLKTGGGHLAPAKAISNYLKEKYSEEIETQLVDGLTEAPYYAKFIVEDGYRILQAKAKWSYEMIYATNKVKSFAQYTAMAFSSRVSKYLRKTIIEGKPDKIIIFHFLLIRPVIDILKEENLNIPVVVVVTDPYTAHPMWFLNKDLDFIIFSERLKEYLISKKIPEEKLHVFPFILDKKYNSLLNEDQKLQIKEKLGFEKDRKILTILGGGDGIPKGKLILKEIVKNINDEIAIVCGKNKRLYRFAIKLKRSMNLKNLKVYGYIDFVYDLLNISDIVITKCGASTFMEILLTKNIPIVNSYIWEQEKGNVDFLVDNNLGIFEPRVRNLSLILNDLLNNDDKRNLYLKNIEDQKLRNGTEEAAEFIYKFKN